MKYQTLYTRLGKQPHKIINEKTVDIIFEDNKYHMSKIKYDEEGNELQGLEIMPPSIYTITVFNKLEEAVAADGAKLGFVDIGSSRTWGFYYKKEWALNALYCNMTDMWETCYHYAVLETYQSGIAFPVIKQEFFKYDPERNGYFEFKAPKFAKNNGGFVFG